MEGTTDELLSTLKDLLRGYLQMAKQARSLHDTAESNAVGWMAKGAAETADLCAKRLSEVISPTVNIPPPQVDNSMVGTFKSQMELFSRLNGEMGNDED